MTIQTVFPHPVTPFEGEAAAAHIGIRFDDRNFELGVSQKDTDS